ncbi:MAG: C39 family peptidase, partial [Firmicutes bacterium]|nr:C39 family peptidase [Bacillota bacterium]
HGESKRLEAIQIKLTGVDADQFDIYYQVHAQNFGWMGWAKNGESAGTAGYSYRLEAIRIMLVPKDQGAPSASVVPAFSDKKNSAVEGNLFIRSTAADFNAADASFDNVEVSNNGDGAVVLKSGVQSGVYTSNSLSTSPFNKLVLSWNSDTPAGTTIQVQARVALTANGQWSNWLTWGTWGTSIKSGSGGGLTDDSVASVDVDTMVVKSGQTASKIQYRVILNSDQSGVTPTLRLVSGALRNTSQGINKVFTDNPDLSNLRVLDVPKLSQMIRDPAIADSICSPTSIAMVLNYYGTQLTPEQVAWGVYDYDYEDFGNWPFNTAYAGSLGYRAYVDYSTIDGLKRETANGHPAIAAVAYKNSANVSGNLPVIDGAPIASTNGHLIVVCGFTNENGIDYIIINDPAAASNAGVRVKYRLDQFQNAWAESGNITYIIHQNEN